jgi:hypothetical protein
MLSYQSRSPFFHPLPLLHLPTYLTTRLLSLTRMMLARSTVSLQAAVRLAHFAAIALRSCLRSTSHCCLDHFKLIKCRRQLSGISPCLSTIRKCQIRRNGSEMTNLIRADRKRCVVQTCIDGNKRYFDKLQMGFNHHSHGAGSGMRGRLVGRTLFSASRP